MTFQETSVNLDEFVTETTDDICVTYFLQLRSSRQHLGKDDCQEDKMEGHWNRYVLCCMPQ